MPNREKILSSISKKIKELEPQADVILFGSQARNDAKEHSDWDILILMPYEVNLTIEQQFRHQLFELELELEACFSIFMYSKHDWETKHYVTPFYKNIVEEGIKI